MNTKSIALFVAMLVGTRIALSADPMIKAKETRITFLGTAAATPGPGEDVACFVINGTLLIDCGFNAALNMQSYGYKPTQIETLFLTHCHHDHYMGLPGLLFYRAMRKTELTGRPPLRVVGTADDLPIVMDGTRKFLQAERFAAVWPPVETHPLEPGKTYEMSAFKIETMKSIHGVSGFCSRYTDKASGVVIAFSGDTGPNPEFAKLARGADLLIHEAVVSSKTPDEKMADSSHSRAIDAARVAKAAGVKELVLIHMAAGSREASLAAAKEIFPNTRIVKEGESIALRK